MGPSEMRKSGGNIRCSDNESDFNSPPYPEFSAVWNSSSRIHGIRVGTQEPKLSAEGRSPGVLDICIQGPNELSATPTMNFNSSPTAPQIQYESDVYSKSQFVAPALVHPDLSSEENIPDSWLTPESIYDRFPSSQEIPDHFLSTEKERAVPHAEFQQDTRIDLLHGEQSKAQAEAEARTTVPGLSVPFPSNAHPGANVLSAPVEIKENGIHKHTPPAEHGNYVSTPSTTKTISKRKKTRSLASKKTKANKPALHTGDPRIQQASIAPARKSNHARQRTIKNLFRSPFQIVEGSNKLALELLERCEKNGNGFICATCKKPFKSRDAIRCHLVIHTGETPYHCPVESCGKKMAWKHSVADHVNKHQGRGEILFDKKLGFMTQEQMGSLEQPEIKKRADECRAAFERVYGKDEAVEEKGHC